MKYSKAFFFTFLLFWFSSTVFGQSGFNPPKIKINDPLRVENIGIDTVRVLDSVRVWQEPYLDSAISRRIDTTNALLSKLYFEPLSVTTITPSYNTNETWEAVNSTITFNANEYHSYTVTCLTGTFDLQEQATIFAIPAGTTITKTATGYFTNAVTITANGRTIINTIK